MAGYIGTKAVNLSTTGADINGDANVDGSLTVVGNVGIGTASPTEKLVVSDTTGATVRINSTKDGTWVADEPYGALEFYGNDTSGTGPDVRTSIEAVSSNTFGIAGSLLFKTNNGAGPAIENMRLTAAGSLGIGTAAPSAKLDVSSGTSSAFLLGADNNLTTRTNSTIKVGRLSVPHYTTTESPFIPISGVSTVSENVVEVGTNSSSANATSRVSFFTGATLTGNTIATERMRIDSGGNLMVGTTTANGLFAVAGNGGGYTAYLSGGTGGQNIAVRGSGTTGTCFRVLNSGGTDVGSIDYTASATTYSTTSDYRLKENITPIQGAGDIVKAMQPATYNMKSDGSWQDGFLAHELQMLIPGAVTGEKDKMKDEEYEIEPEEEAVLDADGKEIKKAKKAKKGVRSVPDLQMVDYSKLTPILTAALQEALNKIDELTARIEALEAV
jgi:hypothetical protein